MIPPTEDAPPEISALLRAKDSGIPVSLILCREAGIAPFALPEDRGCAFLGFFAISKIDITVVSLTHWVPVVYSLIELGDPGPRVGEPGRQGANHSRTQDMGLRLRVDTRR